MCFIKKIRVFYKNTRKIRVFYKKKYAKNTSHRAFLPRGRHLALLERASEPAAPELERPREADGPPFDELFALEREPRPRNSFRMSYAICRVSEYVKICCAWSGKKYVLHTLLYIVSKNVAEKWLTGVYTLYTA